MSLKPEVVEIQAGTERHAHVLEAIRQRYDLSRHRMSERYDTWAKMEERFRAYVNLKEQDRLRQNLRSTGRPQYVTIDVPYSYAMLLTLHTYLSSVFLARSPVLQFSARNGESAQNEMAVEAVMDYQFHAGGMLLPMYLWLMDAAKYGLGVIMNGWFDEQRIFTQIVEEPANYFGIPIPGKTRKKRQTVRVPGYQGNRTFNVRPQDFFPDPRVSFAQLQKGEFCGRIVEVGWNTVVRREQDGWYYNVEELRKNLRTSPNSYGRDRGSSQLVLPQAMDTLYYRGKLEDPASWRNPEKKEKSFIELLEMEIELIPRDWGLSGNTYPEKWVFTVGNDEVILNAMPKGSYHDQFEFFPLEYEIEGYALSKRSMLEVVDPLNEVLSWLFNSHMYNVRKALNDQLVVDPSRVVMKDINDPAAGRIVRLKPEAYGTDPKLTVHQLAVTDVTQTHLRDFSMVADLMQRVLGVNDQIMGQMNTGGRQTATAVRTSTTLGINRLKTVSEYMSAMGFMPWASVMLQNTQQRMSMEQALRIAGSSFGTGERFVQVDPSTVAGQFDFVPVDGTMPVDRFAMANLWKELAQAMRQMPEVAQGFDWTGIMGWIAQMGGAKNFDQFRIQARVVPDDQIGADLRRGNVTPIPRGGGPASGVGPGSGSAPAGSPVPGAATVSGVGRTG